VISEEELGIIDAEANRLHLSKEEIDRLLAKAQREYQAEAKGGGGGGNHDPGVNMMEVAGRPQRAAQCYRELLSKICQLNLAVAEKAGGELPTETLTSLEQEIWAKISGEMKKSSGA
jgi:hypothetical protein